MANHHTDLSELTHDYESGGIAVGGFMFVGIGAGIVLGWIYNSVILGVGVFVAGVGLGLLAMALISRRR